MLCTDTPPVDGPGWAALAACLDDYGLHEAAVRAWRKAWEIDPTLADLALDSALEHAHQTGDDALVVDIAASLPSVDDPDVAGHLAVALHGGEIDALREVVPSACRYPYAQYLLAERYRAAGRLRSSVSALGEVIEWDGEDALGRGPRWEVWGLQSLSLLHVASTYAAIGHAEQAATYAAVAGTDDPHARYLMAWAALRTGDDERASTEASAAADIVPEASLLSVVSAPDALAAAKAAEAHWTPLRAELAAFVVANAEHPEEVPGALLDELSEVQEAISAVGSMSPLLARWVRAHDLEREARRVRRDPIAAELVAEARAELDRELGAGILELVERGVERIDAVLLQVAREARGEAPAHEVRPWVPADFGW